MKFTLFSVINCIEVKLLSVHKHLFTINQLLHGIIDYDNLVMMHYFRFCLDIAIISVIILFLKVICNFFS